MGINNLKAFLPDGTTKSKHLPNGYLRYESAEDPDTGELLIALYVYKPERVGGDRVLSPERERLDSTWRLPQGSRVEEV